MTHQIFSPTRVGLPLRFLQPASTIRVQVASRAHGEQNVTAPADIMGLARWIDTFEAENHWDSGCGVQLVSASTSVRPTP